MLSVFKTNFQIVYRWFDRMHHFYKVISCVFFPFAFLSPFFTVFIYGGKLHKCIRFCAASVGNFSFRFEYSGYMKTIFFTGLITFFLLNSYLFAQNKNSGSSHLNLQKKIISKGVVNTFKLNIRKKPARGSDVVIVVEKGQIIDILKKQGGIGGWLTVSYQGNTGFIRNRPQYIKLLKYVPKPVSKPVTKKVPKKKIKEKKIKERIKSEKKNVETITQKEIEIIEGLNDVDYTLNQARIRVTALSEELRHLGNQIELLKQEREQLSKSIAFNSDYAGQRLKALYKMNMVGRVDSTGLPDSIFDFFLMQNSMKQIIQSVSNVLEKQNQDLENLEILEQNVQKQARAKTSLEAQLNDQIRINKKETAKKQSVLKDIRKKKMLSLAVVESLKHAALKLDSKITDMQTMGKGKGKGKQFDNLNFSFSKFKGKLDIPVEGKIISKYGPLKTGNYKGFTFQKGIDIKVERGEPVKSVFKGEVMFAQWLKGYGNLLIVNHGDNYYTLYAHVDEIFKQKGESVETGEVIATAGDTGSIKGLCLHFEVRHHGEPVNPMKWLKKGA